MSTGRELIVHLIARGFTDEEGVAHLVGTGMRSFSLDFDRAVPPLWLREPPDQRRLLAIFAEIRGTVVAGNCSGKLGTIEREYRKAGGRPTAELVAARLDRTPRTVRRWLDPMSWAEFHDHMAERHPR